MTSARPASGENVYRIKVAEEANYLAFNASNQAVLQPLDQTSNAQKWFVKYDPSQETFTARNASNGQSLVASTTSVSGSLSAKATSWLVTERNGSPNYSLISDNASSESVVLDCVNLSNPVHFTRPGFPRATTRQRYLFEPTTASDPGLGGNQGQQGGGVSATGTEFERRFFTLTTEQAQSMGPYDIIIVGTGIGGGVLARDMYETNSRLGDAAKSILVIEKGGLVFHSHCLNTSRPEGLGNNRGQQNDTFFALFKEDYKIQLKNSNEPLVPPSTWKGGPMHCIGGRSAAWGLFAPRVHDDTLRRWFPKNVEKDLKETYFEKADKLFNLSLPNSKIIHQHLLERLNTPTSTAYSVNWQWGRIASEFKDSKNFDFAEGAYSTIDKLLEIMMSKPPANNDPTSNERSEHKNFKMLIRTEVRKLELSGTKVTGVVVRPTPGGTEKVIKLKPGGQVVLAAGSVASPTILLRSGYKLGREAGHITDHDILYRAVSFRYLKPEYREEVGSMKLQTYFPMGVSDHRYGLANMSIDASSFLPRANSADKNLPQMIMSFILPCALENDCNITLEGDEPKVVMSRTTEYSEDDRKNYLKRMEDVTKEAMKAIKSHLKVEFVNENRPGDYLSYLELGGVAHELGTLPMPGRGVNDRYSIDSDLKVADLDNCYVCDLSIFPMSPEANPTLTLAALTLRLSRHLSSREKIRAFDADTIWIVNHSGEVIKVWVSNYGAISRPKEETDPYTLLPGLDYSCKRRAGTDEAVFVFRLDRSMAAEAGKPLTYTREPELFVAHPGLGAVTIN
ncbi:hypothetical protein FRB94_001630 [Tulasnella sp. JGI-2019a]|nr:hypothetical protein FRB94_001630 [Tulasnella sp. JGI-2019a]KAG9036860.1 hypothetical protein FRB95_007705 [Tulasnella sp. JGI-2019a]